MRTRRRTGRLARRTAAGLAAGLLAGLLVGGTGQAAADATGHASAGEVRQSGLRGGVPVFTLTGGALPPPAPRGTAWTGYYTWTSAAGHERTTRVHVPAHVQAPAPVVVSLHGLYQRPETTAVTTGWERLGGTRGFVTVTPSGHGSSWNAGRCCGRASRAGLDDPAEVLHAVRVASALVDVDPERLYLSGFSNGGMMALSLACRQPGVWAAALVVAGAHVDGCRPTRGVPLRQVHGQRDTVVPLARTVSRQLGTWLPSVRDTQALWRSVNAPAGLPTQVVTVSGGGHTWFAGHGRPGAYDTTGQGWRFLSQHRRAG